MNIPPLRSRTPPPLCDSESNENEDSDFGNFAMCSDIGGDSYDDFRSTEKTVGVEDSASEDSGLCTSSSIGQAHSPYETSPTTGLKGLPNGESHLFESLPTNESIQEHQLLQQHTLCDDAVLIGEEDGDAHIEIEDVQRVDETTTDPLVSDNSLSHHNSQEITVPSLHETSSSVVLDCETKEEVVVTKVDEFGDETLGDFEEFQIFEEVETKSVYTATEINTASDYSYFNPHDSDDVSDIPSEKDRSIIENWDQRCTQSDSFSTNQMMDDIDEFSEFQTSSFLPSIESHSNEAHFILPPLPSGQFLQATEDEESGIIEECAVVNMDSVLVPFLKDLVYQSHVWSHLHTLDDTPALRYQWASSSCNRKLLNALKIDSRNILCSFWNKSLKIGIQESSSLDLVKLGSDFKEPTKPQYIPKNIVPDAHFDWDGSGLTNPLDSCKDTCASTIPEFNLEFGPSKISQQAEEILSSLPDRSYLKKTYIVFKKIP